MIEFSDEDDPAPMTGGVFRVYICFACLGDAREIAGQAPDGRTEESQSMNITGDWTGGPALTRVCVNCGESEELEKVEFEMAHSDDDPLGTNDGHFILPEKFILCYGCVKNATQHIEAVQRRRWRKLERDFYGEAGC